MSTALNYLPEVKEQYEDYPYPPRDPQNEQTSFLIVSIEMPERLNHYGFGGRQSFSDGFRILVAGGGTGDSSIFMAEQYGSLGAEIIHLDLSAASIEIARQRAKMRGIEERIRFVQASLLDLPSLGLGEFDYINCSGVLHHLIDPQAGLRALTSVLAPDGVISIMVYAKYGRQAIYLVQDMFRELLGSVSNRAQKIRLARQVLSNLPRNHWHFFTEKAFRDEFASDQGLYDALLHPQDRAYTVPEIYDWLDRAGLAAPSFQHRTTSGAHWYDPARLDLPPAVLAKAQNLTLPERQALTELIQGMMFKHIFYAARSPLCEPEPEDAMIVSINPEHESQWPELCAAALCVDADIPVHYAHPVTKQTITLQPSAARSALVATMTDGHPIGEVVAGAIAGGIAEDVARAAFHQLFADLRRHDIVFLRAPAVPVFDSPQRLQQRMLERIS